MDSPPKDKGLVLALLEASSDLDISVRKTISASLIQLGCQHHSLVLSSIRQFLDNTHTTPKAHIQSDLYNTAEGIIRERGDKIEDEKVIEDWVIASRQLLTQPTIAHDLQQAASSLLVSLACTKLHSIIVLNSLTELLKPEEVPPQTIIETLSTIAVSNSRAAACYFGQIMTNLSPYLIHIKNENLRIAIASLLGKYSESVVDAVHNKEPVDTLSLEDHYDQCSFIYDIFTQHWLRTSQVGAKNEIILSLGHMSFLLSKEKLEIHSVPLISTVIGHYKRNPYPFTLTYSLALVIDALMKVGIDTCIRVHIDSLLSTLFSQVCIIPNFSEPHTVKNHCEVLRCFDMLAKGFPEPLITLLVQRLENASHVQRVGSLVVLKHLVNSHSITSDHISKLITILNMLLSDPNSKVVRHVAQVIVALCHNAHLDASTGAPFITYLVQHSAGGTLDSRRSSHNELGEEFIGDICCRALNLLATSMKSAIPLLWPQLLQYVTNLEYQQSFPTILSCLASLLQNSETAPTASSQSPFKEIGPTSAPYIFNHLLLMCCSPNDSVGLSGITILQGLAGHVSPTLTDVWSEHLPQLKETYTSLPATSMDPASIQIWQDSLRDFLGCTIKAINSEAFTAALITAQMEQLEVWEKNQLFRCFLMSVIGVALKYCTNRSLIESTLDFVYNITNHKSSAEQESFSLCIGMASCTHMSYVLSHIETWLKSTDTLKRSSLSIFHLLKHQDGRSEDAVWVRSSLILCLGQIASLAPADIVGSYIDGPIMLHLLNIINSNKSDLINDVTLQTVSKIAKALLCLPGFKLRQRPLFLTHIVSTIKQENISLTSLTGALQVLRDLVALEPELNVEERTIVLQASLSSTLTHLQRTSVTEDAMLERCYSQLNVFIRTLIQHDTCPATLDDVTTLLHTWTLSAHEIVRVKALDLLVSSFCTFLQHLVLTHFGPTSFNQTCQLLAMLTPRCADPCREVRSQSVACVYLVLKILARYNGLSPEDADDDMTSLKALEDGIREMHEEDLSEGLFVIAKVLCNKLSFVQLRLYLSLVVIGLQDLQNEAAVGVAQILADIFSLRGHQFHQHIKDLLDSIYRRLEKVSHAKTTHFCVEAICNLAKHNIITVIEAIMMYPVPYERSVCETLQRIGCESELCAASLTHFTQILERTQLFSEHQTAMEEDVKIATLSTLTAICSMKELLTKLSVRKNSRRSSHDQSPSREPNFSVAGSQQIVNEKLPCLMALLLLSYGSYIGTIAPLHQSMAESSKNSFIPNRNAAGLVPSKCALECLQALVGVSGCTQLEEALSSQLLNPHGDTVQDFLHGLSNIALLFVQEAPMHISSLVAYLDAHHDHEIQRMTVTAVFGELVVEKCCGDFELLEIIVSGLLARLNDRSGQVRRLAVKGLANFARLQYDQMNFPPWFQMSEKMSEVVSALVSSTDLREGSEALMECQVALEALRGLASLLPHLPSEIIVQHAPTLLIRIRLFVEKSNGEVREASMGVLRGLSVCVGDTDEFKEQIHLHLLTSVIHLEDPYPSMVVMCKSALQSLGPHLSSKNIQKLFDDFLVPSGTLNFQEFVALLAKKLVTDMRDHISLFLQVSSSYFRHSEPTIRRASILLTGYLIESSCESLVSANLQRVYHGIIYLLQDADQTVRCAAAAVVPLVAKHEKIL